LRAFGERAMVAADETRGVAGGDALFPDALVVGIPVGMRRRRLVAGTAWRSRASARRAVAVAAAVAAYRCAATGRVRGDGDRRGAGPVGIGPHAQSCIAVRC